MKATPRMQNDCLRCGHKWFSSLWLAGREIKPEEAKKPGVCPKCKSRLWSKENLDYLQFQAVGRAEALLRRISAGIENSTVRVPEGMDVEVKKVGTLLNSILR